MNIHLQTRSDTSIHTVEVNTVYYNSVHYKYSCIISSFTAHACTVLSCVVMQYLWHPTNSNSIARLLKAMNAEYAIIIIIGLTLVSKAQHKSLKTVNGTCYVHTYVHTYPNCIISVIQYVTKHAEPCYIRTYIRTYMHLSCAIQYMC